MTSTTDHYRVTIWLPSGPPLELVSTTEPRRLDNGVVIANWLDHPKYGQIGGINWALVPLVTWRQGNNKASSSVA